MVSVSILHALRGLPAIVLPAIVHLARAIAARRTVIAVRVSLTLSLRR